MRALETACSDSSARSARKTTQMSMMMWLSISLSVCHKSHFCHLRFSSIKRPIKRILPEGMSINYFTNLWEQLWIVWQIYWIRRIPNSLETTTNSFLTSCLRNSNTWWQRSRPTISRRDLSLSLLQSSGHCNFRWILEKMGPPKRRTQIKTWLRNKQNWARIQWMLLENSQCSMILRPSFCWSTFTSFSFLGQTFQVRH